MHACGLRRTPMHPTSRSLLHITTIADITNFVICKAARFPSVNRMALLSAKPAFRPGNVFPWPMCPQNPDSGFIPAIAAADPSEALSKCSVKMGNLHGNGYHPVCTLVWPWPRRTVPGASRSHCFARQEFLPLKPSSKPSRCLSDRSLVTLEPIAVPPWASSITHTTTIRICTELRLVPTPSSQTTRQTCNQQGPRLSRTVVPGGTARRRAPAARSSDCRRTGLSAARPIATRPVQAASR
jgi:hypothetical protein